jgi:chemotaxis family two-component system response regulator Rcp1
MNQETDTINRVANILLIEDNPADVLLMSEALKEGNMSYDLSVVNDGMEAMDFLLGKGEYAGGARPDLILLDINLPKKNGFEVLKEIRGNPDLKCVPVIILTTSAAKQDINKAYNLCANAYIIKPVELDDFLRVMKSIEDFWFSIATLP